MVVEMLEIHRVSDVGTTSAERERFVAGTLFFEWCRRCCLCEVAFDDSDQIVIDQFTQHPSVAELLDVCSAYAYTLLVRQQTRTFTILVLTIIKAGALAAEVELGGRVASG